MQNKTAFFKKSLALVLVLVFVLSAVHLTAFAAGAEVSITEGALVAANYDGLSAAETAILNSAAVKGVTVTYHVPDATDNLVAVDAAAKTVTAQPITLDGHTWIPTAAVVVYDSGSETVALAASGAAYAGTFNYAGNAYHVDVTYSMSIAVDAALQATLLNGPYNVMRAIDCIDALDDIDCVSGLFTIADNINELKSLNNILSSTDTKNAITALADEVDANVANNMGKHLNLELMLDDYEDADAATEYLFASGLNMKTVADTTLDRFKVIYNDAQLNNAVSALPNNDPKRIAYRTIGQLISVMEDALIDEEWGVLSNDPFKAGLSTADYVAIDDILFAAGATVSNHTDAIKAELGVDPVVITTNVNQYNVTVNVTAEAVPATAINSAVTSALQVYNVTLQLTDGATAAEVRAAIAANGIEAAAVAAWGVVDTAHFTRTETAIPATLTGDLVYTIAYAPINYTVDLAGTSMQVPYGYNLKLPVRTGTENLVYDYYVGTAHYLQGKILKITGDTVITRTEGKPWTVMNENKITAEVLAGELSATEKEILNSAALISNDMLIRYPTNEDNLVTITRDMTAPNKYTVTASNFNSDFYGLVWVPVELYVINGTAIVDTKAIAGGAASFTCDEYDSVRVRYELNLEASQTVIMTRDDAIDDANMTKTLADEAKAQKENMAVLTGLYDRLSQLDRQTLNLINVGINGSNMGPNASAAVSEILDLCSNKETGSLYLYEYLTDYNANGLTFYYRNWNKILDQVNVLNANLSTIYNDPEFEDLLTDIGYHEYYGKIERIINDLSTVTITGPNAVIDVDSPSLNDLVASINALIDNTHVFGNQSPIVINTYLTAPSDGKAVVTLIVSAHNSAGDTLGRETYSAVFTKNADLTAAEIAGLEAAEAALTANLPINPTYYDKTGALNLTRVDGNTTVTITYAPKQYTAVVRNEANAEVYTEPFYYDDARITLPACTTEGALYNYTVSGTTLVVGSQPRVYTFTEAEINAGAYAAIRRETIDVNREALLSLIDELNKATLDAGMKDGDNNSTLAFIPVEDASGNLTIVIRVSPKNLTQKKLQDAFENISKAIIGSDFLYIKLGNGLFRDDNVVSVQTIIDAVLNSGSSLDSILTAINEDGDVNEMTLPGNAINAVWDGGNFCIPYTNGRVNDAEIYGGKLMESTMAFGTTPNEEKIRAALVLTVEDFDLSADDLKSVRKAVNKARSYGNVTAVNGELKVNLTVPDRVYQAYLTALLGLGEITLDDLSNIPLEDVKDIIFDLLDFIADDATITIDTYENTADKVNYNADLSSFRRYYSKARKALKHVLDNVTYENESFTSTTYAADAKYGISRLLDSRNVQDTFKNIIKETRYGADDPVVARVNLTINNDASEYKAIVVDKDAAGTGKFVYTRDLAASVAGAHNNTIIILLDDHAGNLNINKNLIIDLNGHRITGDLACNSRTVILDSKLATNSGAGVSGNVTGNAIITAGTYTSDVSSKIKDGYLFENGTVKNGFYYITDDNRGNIEVHLTPDEDVVRAANRSTAEAVAIELAADLALNYYTTAALTVGGNDIFAVNVNDVLNVITSRDEQSLNAIIDCIDCAGITAFANDLLDKLIDLTTVGNKIKNNQAVASYSIQTNPWTYEPIHVTNGDYLSVNIKPNNNITKNETLSVYVDENGGISDLFLKYGEITTIDADVELSSIDYSAASKDIIVTGSGMLDVTFDMRHDPNFAIAIGVVLADGLTGAKRDAIIDAINVWYTSGIMSDLKAAIEDVSTDDFLEKFGSNKAFTAMLADTGLDGVVDAAVTDLYNSYRKGIIFLTKVINRTGVMNGSATTLGTFETNEYGTYSDSRSRTYTKSRDIYNLYGLKANATLTNAKLTIKLFTPIIRVTDANNTVVYEGDDLVAAFAAADDGSTVEVLDDVVLADDAEVDCTVTLIGANYIDFNGKTIKLTDVNAELTADLSIFANVSSGVNAYNVTETAGANNDFVYKLEGVSVNIGWSISLEDEIVINLYIYNLTGAQPADCRLVCTDKNDAEIINEALVDATTMAQEDQANKVEIARFAAKEMTDLVNVKIYYNNSVIKETDLSIQKYCETVISLNGLSDELKELCHYVLNYGAEAQKAFNYKTDDLANRGVNYKDGIYYANNAPVELDDTVSVINKTGDDIAVGASASLEYRTEFNLYFSSAYTYDIVRINGVDYTSEVVVTGDAYNYVPIRGIAARQLNQTYVLYLHTTSGKEVTLTHSVLSYAFQQYNANTTQADVCKALFNYYLAAKAFFEFRQQQGNP